MTHPRLRRHRRGRAQFGLAMLMLITLLVAVMAAVFGGLMRGGADQTMFVLIGLIAPVGVMLLLSLWRQVRQWRNRK